MCKISTLDLTVVHMVKSKVEILQHLVAFSEYMNFIKDAAYHSRLTLHFVIESQKELRHCIVYLLISKGIQEPLVGGGVLVDR